MFDDCLILRAVRAFAVGGALAATVGAGRAQAPAEAGVERLERVVVTGSHIVRADAATPSALQVVTREDIERSGRSSLGEVLQAITAANNGSPSAAFTDGVAVGGSGLSLRGLGVNATLVLVNGRRMAPYGLADDGQRSFVDLNSLPLEAVERIEVLKDGASAIYGSDAIAGVVNVILRRRMTGFEMAADAGASYRGDGGWRRLSATFGRGDIGRDGYDFFVSGEYSTSAAIAQATRRSYLGTDKLDTLPDTLGYYDKRIGGTSAAFNLPLTRSPYGSIRDPATGLYRPATACPETKTHPSGDVLCVTDGIRYRQIQPQLERFNLVGRGELRLDGRTQAYVEAGLFAARLRSQGAPTPISSGWGVVATNGFLDNFDVAVPVGHPDNPFDQPARIRLLTENLGGRNRAIDNLGYRFVAGIGGSLSGWDYDGAVGYLGTRLTDTVTGSVRYSVLDEGLASGQFRLGPVPMDAAYAARLSPVLGRTATSSIAFADIKASRELLPLGGGALALAVGAELRRERSDTPSLPYTFEGDLVGQSYTAHAAARTVAAAFGELDAPVTRRLRLLAALRYDRYSDYGSSTTPRLGFRFAPLPRLAVRGTYAEAFRAPGPAENGRSASAVYVGYLVLTRGNPEVRPERARSATLGIVAEPVRGASLSVDFWRIVRTGEITGADAAFVVGAGQETGTPLASVDGRQAGSKIVYDEAGNISAIIAPYFNGGRTTTHGVDVEARQRVDLGAHGRLTASFAWTHVASFAREVDGMTFEYAGSHGPYALGAAAGTPKDRLVLGLTWDIGAVSATLRANHVSAMQGVDHSGAPYDPLAFELGYVPPAATQPCGAYFPDGRAAPGGDCRIASFTSFDLSGRWKVSKQLTLVGSVVNLFNRLAPWDPYTYGSVNYNSGYHQDGAVGRFLKVGLRYRF